MGIVIGSLEQGLIYGFLALGVYLAFRILNFPDLTVDGSFPMGAAISALFITKGLDPFISLVFAGIAGGFAGLLTGLLHTKGKINGLLAGILSMTALYSINLKIMGTSNLSLFRHETIFTPLANLSSFSYTIFLFLLVFLAKKVLDWFLRTDLGLAVRATGDNSAMIRSLGVSTNQTIILGLVISNALVGLAGGIMAQYQGYADVQMGIGMIVVGLASVIIGEVIFGTISIERVTLAVIGGAIVYRLVIAIALYLPFISPTDMKLITAMIVIIALTIPKFSLRKIKKNESTQKSFSNTVMPQIKEVKREG